MCGRTAKDRRRARIIEGPTGGWSVERAPTRRDRRGSLWQIPNTKLSTAAAVVFPSTNCINSNMICNSTIALRGIYTGSLKF